MPAGKYRQNLYKLGSGIFQRLLTHKQKRTRTDHLHTFINRIRDNVRERLLVHILRKKLYPNRVAKENYCRQQKNRKEKLRLRQGKGDKKIR